MDIKDWQEIRDEIVGWFIAFIVTAMAGGVFVAILAILYCT
jgi:hypothetical protein